MYMNCSSFFWQQGKQYFCCEKIYCDCNVYATKPHFCFMKGVAVAKDVQAVVYFFDFETKMEPDMKLFVPYFCVLERVCKHCKEILFERDDDGYVKNVPCCGQGQFVFEGDDTIDAFCEFIFSTLVSSVWVAHNTARFDCVCLEVDFGKEMGKPLYGDVWK